MRVDGPREDNAGLYGSDSSIRRCHHEALREYRVDDSGRDIVEYAGAAGSAAIGKQLAAADSSGS